MSTKCHPKRGLLVDKSAHEMSPKVSTRYHLFCPRDVNYYVHEMSATHWNIVSTTNILAVQCFDIHTQPVNCKFVFAVYWHGPVGVYGAEFPRHLGAKPQIYDNETLDLINLLYVLPSGIYVCSFSLYVKVIHLKYYKNILMLWHTK